MDDVLDVILKNGYAEMQTSAPPAPPPPPPAMAVRSGERTPPPPAKSPTTTVEVELPQLDFGDLSFDLSQLPDLGWDQRGEGSSSQESMAGGSQESMDVDMDVADWLDSLLPSNSNANSMGCDSVVGTTSGLTFPGSDLSDQFISRNIK